MGEWKAFAVADLQRAGTLLVEDGNHGEYRPRSDEFSDEGVHFIRAADMSEGRVLFGSASRINETARRRITKGVGAPSDVLLSHKGTVGKVARVPAWAPPFVCSPQTTFWRSLDGDKLDPGYLYAYLRSPNFHRQLASRSAETDMAPYVSLTAQRSLTVIVPPVAEQRAIAAVLGALDDKIELNRRMNETLEEMARALFKSWFIDFDPVHAKAAGRAPFGMDAATAALFPASFSGNLPTGWTVSSIGDQVRVVGGSTPSTDVSEYWDGPHRWARPKDLSGHPTSILLDTERRITDAGLAQIGSGLLPPGTVLLSSRAPIGYLAIAETPVAVNQGFVAMICDRVLSKYYVLEWARATTPEIVARASGTTFPEISKAAFRPIPVPVPSLAVVAAFDQVVAPLFDRVRAAMEESATLAALRDLLLPKLLSGELRIRDAERTVAEAL